MSENEQLDLIPMSEAAGLIDGDRYKEGEYTLERLRSQEPRLLAGIASLRASGMGIKDVARLLNVHNKTVMAVDREYADGIATRKEKVARLAMAVSELALEAALEKLQNGEGLSKEKIKDLVISSAAAADKALLMAGEATQRVAVDFSVPGQDAFERALAAAQADRTGLEGGTPGQKEGSAALPPAERVVIDLPADQVEVAPAVPGGPGND